MHKDLILILIYFCISEIFETSVKKQFWTKKLSFEFVGGAGGEIFFCSKKTGVKS